MMRNLFIAIALFLFHQIVEKEVHQACVDFGFGVFSQDFTA